MKKLLISLSLLTVVVGAQAQAVAEDRSVQASTILMKTVQVDLLNQMLPLLFTKQQWGKVLTAVESCRETVRSTERNEFEELKKLDGRLTAAIEAAIQKGELPKPELIVEYKGRFLAFEKTRQFMAIQNVEKVYEVFNAVANTGQKKTAMNSLDAKRYGKVEEMKEEQKIKLYISEVILNPLAYDLMRKLLETAQGG